MRRFARRPSLVTLDMLALLATGCHTLESVTPDPAEAGDLVTVTGSGFGADQAASKVLYDGVALAVVSWSDTEVVATLPDPKADGTYPVQVEVKGRLSNALTHEIVTNSFEVLVPDGAVSFQEGTDCPPGWQPVVDAEGRFLVGRTDGTEVGVTVGTPLAAGEDRTHGHGYATSVNVASTGIAVVTGCCNGSLGDAGSHPLSGSTDAAAAGPPRIYQLVCERAVEDPPPAHDDHPFPNGTVMLFDREGCPDGFELMGEADGRFLVPTPTGGTVGQTVGTPLASGEDRGHAHSFSASITVPQNSIAALGGGNNNHAKKGTYGFSGTTNGSASGVPYLQLLVCRATDRDPPPPEEPVTGDLVPAGTFSFFDLDACPDGWTRSGLHEGRFLTGLLPPSGGGLPYETRGGAPLAPGEDRLHTHSFSGSVNVPSLSAAIVSGCCFNDTGGHGSFGYAGTTGAAPLGLPYISLLGCEKD
ncbi:MAG: IPT/TIG domain-containing protein [Planctomycetes bacterium]|nr:IPT/TIG domain-containing protein [Planctomycetota bacterium]